MRNIFTVDVEDYFQVEAFQSFVCKSTWPKFKLRVRHNIDMLLTLLQERNVNGTFFILGWIAEKDPDMVKKIHAAGHEIASHGYGHQMITKQSKEVFREDIKKAKEILEDITGDTILGYRAPTYSIVDSTLWALEVLKEEGYEYDSSIYPIVHDRYGIPDAKRRIHSVKISNGAYITEVPMSTIRFIHANIPIGSGGYLRILPLLYTYLGMKFLNTHGIPVIVNLHPWELDHEQPPLPVKGFQKFRHYKNLDKMEQKLRMLLKSFEFTSVREYLEIKESG